MKKWFIFGGGVITGIVLTFIVTIIYAANQPENGLESDNGMTLFDTPGETVNEESFGVFQVIEENAALVRGKGTFGGELHIGIVYLLINDEGKYYYDDEIIKVPNGKIVRQMGVYRYLTKDEFEKTVPIVKIVNK